jgi:hypothetical protein
VANGASETIAVKQVFLARSLIAKHPSEDDGGEDDSDGNELVAIHLLLLRPHSDIPKKRLQQGMVRRGSMIE